jgi:predicted ATPase
MKNIQEIHEEVFNYLNSWSEQSRNRNNVINPYFYMRSVRDERFKKGFWFPGNDSYMCISFWAGGDSNHKTPNLYFEIHEKYGCRVIIVAKDSASKYEYFEKMIRELNDNDSKPYSVNKKGKIWIKQLSNNWEQWSNALQWFTDNDKRGIDEFINKNEFSDFEEFASRFGFINSKDFDTMYSRVLKERDSIKEIEYNKQREFLNKPKLPYALLGINIENFQGITNASIKDFKPNARWIFITGENGYGKTTLLQAIALGLSGDPDLEKYLDSNTRISIELVHQNEKAFPVRTKGNISNLERYDYGQFVLGYGPARLNVQSKASENKEDRICNNVLSLFDYETYLKNINYELFASNHSDLKTYAELEVLIKTVTKGRISGIKIKDREAQFIETLSNGDSLEPMPLSKLAAGFRSIINIVIDIYLRFKKIHQNKRYVDFYGIVLIDEIENHLHPILQKELPITLSQVFPNIQFIISTHSPIPLLAADENSIILRVNRTKEDGVSLELIEIDNILALTPNILYTSPVFGFSDIINDNLSSKQNLRTEDSWDDMIKTDDLDKTLIEMYNKRKNK